MKIELPQVGESVTDGVISRWLKNIGDSIEEILKKGETYELKYIFVNEQKNDFHGFIDDVYDKEMDYPYLNKIFDSDESGFKQLKVKIFKIN